MKPWPRRKPTALAPRANPTRIAVLEHDLLGVQPEPGSPAALALALRRTSDCITHQPVDITTLSDRRPVGLCQSCGRHMVHDTNGEWRIA
jgi:hypothetical protein